MQVSNPRMLRRAVTAPELGRSSSPFEDLPFELLDLILGSSGLDGPSLKMCSLVCKAWALRSRLYLFSQLNLCSANAPKLLNLLDSPQSTLPLKSCARSLVASVPPPRSQDDSSEVADFFKAVNVILDAGIKTLEVHKLFMRHLDVPRLDLNQITALHVRQSSFDHVGSLAGFLSDFDYLESLTLENTYLTRNPENEEVVQDHQGWTRHLQSLSIHGTMGSFTNPSVSMSPLLECVRESLRQLTLKGCVHPG